MKKITPVYLIFLSILLLFACKKETDLSQDVQEGDFFWTPFISAKRSDKKIDLYFNTSNVIIEYIKEPLDPDYIEVYFSDNADDLKLVKTIEDVNREKITFDGLINDKAYYMQVVTGKKGLDPITSYRITTTPGTAPEMEELFPAANFELQEFNYSFDRNYFTFKSDRGNGENIYLQKEGTDFSFDLLTNSNYDIGWSPIKNELVYIEDTIVGNYLYPLRVIKYDIETEVSETLFTVDYNNFLVHQVGFTPDGQKILFLSNEGNEDTYSYDFWTYDLVTKERMKYFDLTALDFDVFNIAADYVGSNQLFLSGTYENVNKGVDLFSYDYANNTLTPIIESEWRDVRPAGSPSGEKVAFFSYRSGTEELWVYDLISKQYQQITDAESPNVDGRYSRISWEDEQTLVTAAYDKNRMKLVRMEIK